MSEILKIIKQRRSIRKYQSQAIPEAAVEKLKQALIWAPSAGNLQARKFYFVFDRETKNRLARANNRERDFIAQAPLVIVACADAPKMEKYGERGKGVYLFTDIASSLQNATLLAYEQGLGSCWVGEFDQAEVRKILKLPEHLCPVIMLPVGYPDETPLTKPRVSAGEAVVEIR